MADDDVVVEIALVPFAGLALQQGAQQGRLLSDQERARANRFKTRELRERYIATRVYMRQALSHRLGRAPHQIDFIETRSGKKVLAGGPHFSVSHTRHWLALAVCDTRETGLDIEPVPNIAVVLDLMHTCCSQEERSRLAALPDETALCQAFARLWTRKEALLKAEGSGLRIPLKAFTVSTDAGCQDALMSSAHEAIEPNHWRVLDYEVPVSGATRLMGAAAVAGRAPVRVSVRVGQVL